MDFGNVSVRCFFPTISSSCFDLLNGSMRCLQLSSLFEPPLPILMHKVPAFLRSYNHNAIWSFEGRQCLNWLSLLISKSLVLLLGPSSSHIVEHASVIYSPYIILLHSTVFWPEKQVGGNPWGISPVTNAHALIPFVRVKAHIQKLLRTIHTDQQQASVLSSG